jgi:hypothetical protein
MSVFAVNLAASGQVYTRRTRLVGLHYVGAATPGTVTFIDNTTSGSGGTTNLVINTPGVNTTGGNAGVYVPIPGDGIAFPTNCWCTIATTAFVTAFFTKDG